MEDWETQRGEWLAKHNIDDTDTEDAGTDKGTHSQGAEVPNRKERHAAAKAAKKAEKTSGTKEIKEGGNVPAGHAVNTHEIIAGDFEEALSDDMATEKNMTDNFDAAFRRRLKGKANVFLWAHRAGMSASSASSNEQRATSHEPRDEVVIG